MGTWLADSHPARIVGYPSNLGFNSPHRLLKGRGEGSPTTKSSLRSFFPSLLACAASRWSQSNRRCFCRIELLLHKATTLRAAIRCMLSLHLAAV